MKCEKLTSLSVKGEVVDEGKRKGVTNAIILNGLFPRGVFKAVEPKNKSFLESLLQAKGSSRGRC